MRVLDPPIRARAAVAVRDRPRTLLVRAAGRDDVRDGVGGPALLRPRLEGPAARTADMNTLIAIGTGAAFAVFGRRHARAGRCSSTDGAPRRRLLRSGDHHHRAGAARQRDGGAREAQHHARACGSWRKLQPSTARVRRDGQRDRRPDRRGPHRRPGDRPARRAHPRRRRDHAAAAAPSTNRC